MKQELRQAIQFTKPNTKLYGTGTPLAYVPAGKVFHGGYVYSGVIAANKTRTLNDLFGGANNVIWFDGNIHTDFSRIGRLVLTNYDLQNAVYLFIGNILWRRVPPNSTYTLDDVELTINAMSVQTPAGLVDVDIQAFIQGSDD